MKRTISAMVGKGSINHNSRKFKAENVDGERSHFNVDYCNENIKKVYQKLFDEALHRYNGKQTRADRRIENYYEKIRNSKQEKPFHELILQIGDKENMGADSENGNLALQILDDYYGKFQSRNSNLYVFSAHVHMDEATPHLHIDFVPFTTGSKRGLDTRVSLKQALAMQGFKGGTRGNTEWSQWIQSEKEQLAAIMERYGIEWEHKGTHEKHLSVLEYKKQELESSPEYHLSEPQGLMSAKSYKNKVAEPLVKRLKLLIKTALVKCFEAWDSYYRLNITNGNLYRDNEKLRKINEKLTGENENLRAENKNYRLLRKMLGSKQMDSLLEQANRMKQTKQREKRFRNNGER